MNYMHAVCSGFVKARTLLRLKILFNVALQKLPLENRPRGTPRSNADDITLRMRDADKGERKDRLQEGVKEAIPLIYQVLMQHYRLG